MPGFITHLTYGELTIPFINNNETKYLIESHIKTFSLGLEGPDIFFYYIPAYLFYKKNIGNVMHDTNVMLFFDALISARNDFDSDFDRKIADSYILGFIGHYTLDTWCHPYIYCRSDHFNNLKRGGKYDFGRHVSLETDIDHVVLDHYKHLLPNQFDYAEAIRPNEYEKNVVSTLLFRAINTTFPDFNMKLHTIHGSINAIIRLNHKMHDPTGRKKRNLRIVEQLLFRHAFISSMVPSDTKIKYKDPCNEDHKLWCNPWNIENTSSDSVFDIINKSMSLYLNRIEAYTACFITDLDFDISKETFTIIHSRNEFLKNISDLSYLSGLPL